MNEQQILQIIRQLEGSIDKIAPFLTMTEFAEYCDTTYNSITQWKVVLKGIKDENKLNSEIG